MRNKDTNIVLKRILVAATTNELCKHAIIDAIATESICEKASISRSSFYRIFESKYSIAPWCQMFSLKKGMGQMGRTLTCQEGLSIAYEGIALFKHLFYSMKHSTVTPFHDEVTRNQTADLIRETLVEFHHKELDEKLNFQIEWITVGGADASRKWIDGSIDKTPAEMAELVESCYPENLLKIFNNPVSPASKEDFDLKRLILAAVEAQTIDINDHLERG